MDSVNNTWKPLQPGEPIGVVALSGPLDPVKLETGLEVLNLISRLNADGSGQIQNSNNIPTLEPLMEIDFGAEYITALSFDPGNLTLVPGENTGGGGGGAISFFWLGCLLTGALAMLRRQWLDNR